MQIKSIKKSAYLLTTLMFGALFLPSCTDNTRAQECMSIRKQIASNRAEIVEISKAQKPYSSYEPKYAELDLQKVGVYERNNALEQDHRTKCGK